MLPRAMRHFDSTRHLRFTQFLNVVIAPRIHHASGGHQLDPIRAVLQIMAYGFAGLIHGISQIGPVREGLVGGENIGVAVAAGNADEYLRRRCAARGSALG